MLAFRIVYLTGVVIAQDRANRRRAEWPPHPDRLFSALTASWGRLGGAAGREALEWLERQPAPVLTCAGRAGRRDAVTHYVPRNDLAAIDKGRNARLFPAVVPEEPVVHIVWPGAEPGPHRAALAALAEDVAWLGHSSTPVAVRLVEDAPKPSLVPAAHGDQHLRVPHSGRLVTLDTAHAAGRLAEPGAWQAYAEPGRPPRPSPTLYGEWQVFRRIGGVGLELRHAALLTHSAHRALVQLADERNPGPVRPVISGRDPDGGVTRAPHLALVPLANLDHDHADGAIMGFATIYPSGLDEETRDYLDTAVAALDHVKMEAGVMGVRRIIDSDRAGLDPARYTRASRHWVTVTPLLFDRHPKKTLTAEAIVRRAVTDTGLPEPETVTLGAWPVVAGVPHPRLMLPRPGHAFRQPPVHALIAFTEPVRGPVLIGAGRFFGLGLCLPIDLGETPR